MTRFTRITVAALAVFAVATAAPAAFAADELNTSGGLTGAGGPLAIHGYDPVAYFEEGLAMRGSHKHQVKHGGATYRFASESNKKRFEKSPDRYLPQYGGFCAYGVTVGKKFDGDPRVWKVVDGKLYFNLNPEIKATWAKDVPGNVKKADRSWQRIEHSAATTL